MDIALVIEEERQRLIKRLEEIASQVAELHHQEVGVKKELSAIQAYIDIKLGRVNKQRYDSSASSNVVNARRTGLRQRVLDVITTSPSGIRRVEIIGKMDAKGNRKMEQAVSNALVALKKQRRLIAEQGVYTVVESVVSRQGTVDA